MFITKKKFQKEIDDAVAKAIEQEHKEQYERETVNEIWRKIEELERELYKHINNQGKSRCNCESKRVLNESTSD